METGLIEEGSVEAVARMSITNTIVSVPLIVPSVLPVVP